MNFGKPDKTLRYCWGAAGEQRTLQSKGVPYFAH